MKEYLMYLLKISVPFIALFIAGYLLRGCEEKPVQPPQSVKEYIIKVDTLKQQVTRWRTKLKPVNIRDTIQVVEQVAIRDTVIRIQDSIIVKQDTIIRELVVKDSLTTQKVDTLQRQVKRERFWKRFWIGVAGIGLIL
ncbi:hypothetical protein UFOVP754_40 [uncultured Caudovirales phage]|uniref:Uncharacterized protein n=1 Tax=uncultured Caudovirales phage TaxID=2100421 RepID=A0A6J7XAZ0_9CAUD|nr:hypothetical protein UFOVP754_40 [uncultured Caudovirales phage]